MAIENPQKGYLYTWNFFDGYLGLPKRKICLRDTKPALLHVAYLGGGDRWDNKGTPNGAILCLILSASPRRQQSSKDYYKYFDNYDHKALSQAFDAKTEELGGGGCAWWSIELKSQDWSQETIDETVEAVLKWHCREIERIKNIKNG